MKLGLPLTAKYASRIPDFGVQKRTAAQQAGINYEKAVAKRLKLLYPKLRQEHGPWLYFSTPKRSGVCQPDLLLWLADDHLLLIEVKLSWVRDARRKLLDFYGPIVAAIHQGPQLSFLQVYKNAKSGCHKRTVSIFDLDKLQPGKYKECQWLGI